MSRLEDTLARQRAIHSPGAATSEVERAVMQRVLTARVAAPRARQWSLAAAVAAVAVGIVLIVTSLPHRSPVNRPVAFVESVILLNDHVCIWLEPANAVSGSTHP